MPPQVSAPPQERVAEVRAVLTCGDIYGVEGFLDLVSSGVLESISSRVPSATVVTCAVAGAPSSSNRMLIETRSHSVALAGL